MALDITPLPVDETGNGSRLERVTFDRADALVMVHALAIATTTAYMCDSPQAANRLEHYKSLFQAMVPPVLKKLRREEDASEIVIAMASADTWGIAQERIPSWDRERGAQVTITVGERAWKTWDRLTEEEFAEMAKAFEDLAPLTCVRIGSSDAA